MSLNRKDDKEVANDGDDDMIGPEAKGHELDTELLSRTHPHHVHRLAIFQG